MLIRSYILILAIAFAEPALWAEVRKHRADPGKEPKIKMWIPDPVDVEFQNFDEGKKRPAADPSTTNKLLDAAGGKGKGGGGGKAGNKEIFINEQAQREKPKTLDPVPDNNTQGPTQPPAGSQGGGEKAVAFPKWYPVCLFADKGVGDVNAAAKGLADAGAECGINVIVFPVSVVGMPADQAAVNRRATEMCNLSAIGANVGSATSCVPYNHLADDMCEPDWRQNNKPPSVGGCAGLRGGGFTQKQLDDLKKKKPNVGNDGSGGGAGGVISSIEDIGSCDKFTVNHESIGHSAIGWPNGDGAGFGIQDMVNTSGTGSGLNWSPAACARLNEVAMPNDGKWKYAKSTQVYYTPSNNPINFMSGAPLFGPPNPPPSSPPKILVNNGAPRDKVFSSGFFSDQPKSVSDSPLAAIGDSSDPERHKKRNNASASIDEATPGKQTGARDNASDPLFKAEAPDFTATGGKSSSSSLTFDEGAGKKSSGGTSSSSKSSGDSSFEANFTSSGEADSGSSIGFDETAKGGETPSKQRQSSLRQSKTEDEMDPSFFRKKNSRQNARGRIKGGALRDSSDLSGSIIRKPATSGERK